MHIEQAETEQKNTFSLQRILDLNNPRTVVAKLILIRVGNMRLSICAENDRTMLMPRKWPRIDKVENEKRERKETKAMIRKEMPAN